VCGFLPESFPQLSAAFESWSVEKNARACFTVSLQTSVIAFPATRTARASARKRVPPHSGQVA